MHQVRERLVSQRTGIINQIRAFLLEGGIAVRQGLRFLRAELPGILAKHIAKGQHLSKSQAKGHDGKWVKTEQLEDHAANKGRG
jgi:transposase